MHKNIKKITLGIRYHRTFRVSSIVGEIVDYVLNDDTSPFGSQFFSEIADMNNNGKVLLNKDGNLLSVDLDSIVLTLVVKEDFKIFLKSIRDTYWPYIAKVLKESEIKNYNRLGIIFDHDFDKLNSLGEVVKNLTQSKINSPDNLELRFSKKISDLDALWKKDIIDYHNVIITYLKNTEGLNVKLDYQTYFSPEIATVSDIEFDKFIDSAEDYLEKNFYLWNGAYEKK